MYQSLKKQKRVHGPTRRTISAAPLRSGRGESTIASSDEGELLAISTAMRKGRPLYFIRTDDGVTLDVLLDKPAAIKRRDAIIDRNQNGPARVRLYERLHTALIPVH